MAKQSVMIIIGSKIPVEDLASYAKAKRETTKKPRPLNPALDKPRTKAAAQAKMILESIIYD